jgi:hypothetical protein
VAVALSAFAAGTTIEQIEATFAASDSAFVLHGSELGHWASGVAGDLLGPFAAQAPASCSLEGLANALTHTDLAFSAIVSGIYQRDFGRPATTAEQAAGAVALDAGTSDPALEASLLAFPVFYALQGGSDAAWIDAVYRSVLGRVADPTFRTFWISQLTGGAMDRSTIALDIAT